MAIEVNASSSVCHRCGTAYGRLKGYFPVNYGSLYKGIGHLPYCRDCVDEMYTEYFAECQDSRLAVRQMCRKLDLYWNEKIYETVEKQNAVRSMMTVYLSKLASVKQAGKSYDDTLREERAIWVEPKAYSDIGDPVNESSVDVPENVRLFWGSGYTTEMYAELEKRKDYWISRLPKGVSKSQDQDIDIGTETLIKQICCLEMDISRDRAQGKQVNASVTTLNNLLGSANLRPDQKKDDADADLEKMPLGVGIQKWELSRPLPETPKQLRDVQHSIKNITTWYLGHACKMVGLKNSYCRSYEDAMEELRVKRPEIAEEDDDEFLNDIFNDSHAGEI